MIQTKNQLYPHTGGNNSPPPFVNERLGRSELSMALLATEQAQDRDADILRQLTDE